MSRTLEAPTPTNISTNSEPEMEKKGTPASPATALASRVFPVPLAPIKSTPFGILAPMSKNFFGFLRKSTISKSSALASFAPATSANVTFCASSSGETRRAIDLPKVSACIPPALTCRDRYQIIPKRRSTGTRSGASVKNQKRTPPSSLMSILTASILSLETL